MRCRLGHQTRNYSRPGAAHRDWANKGRGCPPPTDGDERPSFGADYDDIVPSVNTSWMAKTTDDWLLDNELTDDPSRRQLYPILPRGSSRSVRKSGIHFDSSWVLADLREALNHILAHATRVAATGCYGSDRIFVDSRPGGGKRSEPNEVGLRQGLSDFTPSREWVGV
jgi:hypothetical protein